MLGEGAAVGARLPGGVAPTAGALPPEGRKPTRQAKNPATSSAAASNRIATRRRRSRARACPCGWTGTIGEGSIGADFSRVVGPAASAALGRWLEPAGLFGSGPRAAGSATAGSAAGGSNAGPVGGPAAAVACAGSGVTSTFTLTTPGTQGSVRAATSFDFAREGITDRRTTARGATAGE